MSSNLYPTTSTRYPMETNLLNILITLGDTVIPVVLDRLKRKKDLAGRVEVSSKMYINHKKSIDALAILIVDEVDNLDNLPKNPTDEDVIKLLRGIGDLERSLPVYPIDENTLAPYTCGTGPIKYDVRDIVDESMRETILTLIKVAIKCSSLPCGLRNLTDDIVWKRMCALVSLIAELLGLVYNCTRDKDVIPPWVFNDNSFVARGTQIRLPGNFTVTLLDERKYFTEEEEAAMREEENERLEAEARYMELMELEQQLPEIFTKEDLDYMHNTWSAEELIKMIKSLQAFFSRTSMNVSQLLEKLNTSGTRSVDLFFTATSDDTIGYDAVRYCDVGHAFELLDVLLQRGCVTSEIQVSDMDGGGKPIYFRGCPDGNLHKFVSEIDTQVPDNWMLTIKVK